MEIYTGRPVDSTGRLTKERKVYDFLDELNIEYTRVDHEALETMEALKQVNVDFEVDICKNLFLCNRQKTAYYLLMMPGDKKFLTKELSSQINSARLSFASGEDMERFLDITPGSLSVMGLMNDTENNVKLLIDEDILKNEYFGCHPCINTSTLRIKVKDLFDVILPKVNHEATIVKLTGNPE